MKIAQVTSYFKPFMVGGAEWYVYNISRELVKAGHEVVVFTADRYGDIRAPPMENIGGIKVRRLPLRIDWSYRAKVWDGLREALVEEDFDVIHTYDYAQMHSLDALNAAKAAGVGSALTVFDVHSAIPRGWAKRLPMKLVDSYFSSRAFSMATRILVRAPQLVSMLPNLNGNEVKVRITPSGVREESLGVFDGEEFKQTHSISGSPVVLFMGRLNPLKGPQHVLAAATMLVNEFPGMELVFVGADQGGFQSTLQRQAETLGLSARVHFTGMIDDFEEKMRALASCDVFVLPSSYEGTSQAIFEAMAQCKPVVATRTGGIPFQVENGVHGYLAEYGDLNELARAIALVLRDRRGAVEMGRRGRERAAEVSYPRLAEGLQSIYGEIVAAVGN